jgi:hypothetical protein
MLIEAREQLRACAAAQCPAVVQTDCAGWLAEVEKALRSVVVAAKDGAGVDRTGGGGVCGASTMGLSGRRER